MPGVDLILANDITAPIAIREFKKIGAKDVFDRSRIALIPDHFAPQKDIKAAEQCKMLREFFRKNIISSFILRLEGWELSMHSCRSRDLLFR